MRNTFLFVFLFFLCANLSAQRSEILLKKGWKFTRDDNPAFSQQSFDDSQWENVRVPHDWAIYGPFSIGNDLQNTAIAQDGQKKAQEHAGRTGGLPFVGCGWYRIHVELENYAAAKRYSLVFDGAMSHAEVFINGKKACYWPYGYNSFFFDITPYIYNKELTIAVRLENLPESSRWYPGAGLYRNVHLIETEDAHVPAWGTQITTPVVSSSFAKVVQKTALSIPQGKNIENYRIVTRIMDERGACVATSTQQGVKHESDFEQTFYIDHPTLWELDKPALYTSESKIYEGDILKDTYSTTFGIRSIELIADKGFFLNGKHIKFKGVCNHHDLGPLGGIANEAGIRRQIRMLKDMGCNAIRTSHNMPSPELVKACDEMGMMLMAESFDEWKTPKCKNGYNTMYDEWVEKDLTNLIRHFRNSPSIVMWSIGNEVTEQRNDSLGSKLSKMMQDICHREDPTRPVTQGMDNADAVVGNNMAAVMDIPGFNYRPFKYANNYEKLPQRLILGAETASTVSSRGVYKFPVERRAMQKYEDHQASGYDVEHCSWSNLPEDDFIQHDDFGYTMGEFVWTGFDYLGEPTPYYSDWPSHSSLFGIIDLAGLPKDRFYLYRSHWNKEEPTLHILPHWNWSDRVGEVTPVFVYTSYPSAELFINGKSQGIQHKDTTVTISNSQDKESLKSLKRQRRYRLMWMHTIYEPGTVKVVAYDKDGKPAAEKSICTAGRPHHIELVADRNLIKADGEDLSFITVKIVDKDGNLCPLADNQISFRVKGKGVYRAGANGNPVSLESFQSPSMKAFYGMMTAIVASTEEPGDIILEATAKGLRKAVIKIQSE